MKRGGRESGDGREGAGKSAIPSAATAAAKRAAQALGWSPEREADEERIRALEAELALYRGRSEIPGGMGMFNEKAIANLKARAEKAEARVAVLERILASEPALPDEKEEG